MHEPLMIEPAAPPDGGRGLLLRVSGRIDGRGSRQLLDACQSVRADRRAVTLDLSAVTFISSTGVGVLLALTEDFRDLGLPLRVADPSPVVRMAISLLNLETYLELQDDAAGDAGRPAA